MRSSPRPFVRGGAVAVVALALAACPPSRAPRGPTGAGFTGCLPLPATSRSALRLGPGGTHLYWTEQVRLHGYDDAWPQTEIVRWPVAGGPVEHLTGLLDSPYRVLSDGRIVGLRRDSGVAVWSPSLSELVSLQSSIDHLELLGTEDAVVMLSGGAIWRQPVHREGARWLAQADALLGVDGDSVYIRTEEGLRRVDARTGAVTPVPPLDDIAKAVGDAFIVYNDEGISVRPAAGGATTSLLAGDDWRYAVGPDGIKAWRQMKAAAQTAIEAAIVTGAGADSVPPVIGADSLEGFVRLPDRRVAYLVGHELDGDDQITTGDEVDVCVAAAGSSELKVERRLAPARWPEAGPVVAALAADRFGGATWHFASGDSPPGLFIVSPAKRPNKEAVREDVRTVATALARAAGDDTLFVDIRYGDGKRGFSEWWATAARRVAWSGIGNATVPDLGDYDVVFTGKFEQLPPEEDEATVRWRCSGTVTNRSDHALTALEADCVAGQADEKLAIVPSTLAPGQTGRFDGAVVRDGTSALAVSIHTGPGHNEVPSFDEDRYDKRVRIETAAAQIYDRATLEYDDANVEGGQVTVDLVAKDKFASSSGQAQELQAAIADEVLNALGPVVLGGQPGDSIRLRITATFQGNSLTWWYEDGELTSDDGE